MHDNQRALTQDQTNKTIKKVDIYFILILIQTLAHESGLELGLVGIKEVLTKTDAVELSANFHVGMHDNKKAQTQDQTNKTIKKTELYYPYFDIDFSS